MTQFARTTVICLSTMLFPPAVMACLWDQDTIRMERSRFPGTLELITGKFLQHSPEFYRWRIADRLQRLESDPANVSLLDDLAVAYDKTGQHDKAIDTARRIEEIEPGRYETAANLATFLIHAGRLQEGLPHLERALTINPDAHFGREKYQKLLVEYLLARRQEKKEGEPALPLATVELPKGDVSLEDAPFDVDISHTFTEFLSPSTSLTPAENAAAMKGIKGMMRFGKYDAPPLLEALGMLLTQEEQGPETDAKQLAARAYLMASYQVPAGPSRERYRALAHRALYMQVRRGSTSDEIKLAQVEADFERELAEAREWRDELREREQSWIRDGVDSEAAFAELYGRDPELSGMEARDPLSLDEKITRVAIVVLVVAALALASMAYALYRYIIRRRAVQSAS